MTNKRKRAPGTLSESTSRRRTNTSTSRDANRNTAPVLLTAIQRTNSTSLSRYPPQHGRVAVHNPSHQHLGAPAFRPNEAMYYYPMPLPPSFPTGIGRANDGNLLPILPLATSPNLPSPIAPQARFSSHEVLVDSSSLPQHPLPRDGSRSSLPLRFLYGNILEHHRRQQQPLSQKFVIEHHDLPDEGILLSSPPVSAPMPLEPCASGMSEILITTESMDAAFIGSMQSMNAWEIKQEEGNGEDNESSGGDTSSVPDCAADFESTDTIGTVDLDSLSDDCVQPVIQSPSQNVRRSRSRSIKVARIGTLTQQEKEFIRNQDEERRNVKNNRDRETLRDKKIKLQEILAKSSDTPEDQTQEEKMFVQACEQARIIKNRRNRARLKERKNKQRALLAKPLDQRSVAEQAYLDQQTAAVKRKNKNDRLRQARNKLLAGAPESELEQQRSNLKIAPRVSSPYASAPEPEPEQQRSNLKIAPLGSSPYYPKIAPRGPSPYDVCLYPLSQLLPAPPGLVGVEQRSKLQAHNEHIGSHNGLIHKDATEDMGSDCADGDNDRTTLGVLVAISATLPLVHVQETLHQTQKIGRQSRARAKSASQRRRVVEINSIKPEDRTPGDDEFLRSVGKQRKDKNTRSRMRAQETKQKLQTILTKSSDERSQSEQAFVEQQAFIKQHKNRGDCLRRISRQLQVSGVAPAVSFLEGGEDEASSGNLG
jgi:hypothetical protein